MVTAKDVARAAGVSEGTVSNVLNRPHLVAERTKATVLAIIAGLGYSPNARARQVRTGTSRTVGLLIPDMGNPFFVALAKGAERAAREAGLQVMVCTSAGSAEEEAEYLSFFAEQHVLGVVVSPVDDPAPALEQLRRQGIPAVLVDRTAEAADACSVTVDNVAGGRLAVQHLVATGHSSVAYVSGPSRLPQVRDRRRGALAALEEAGLPLSALVEIPSPCMDLASGRQAGGALAALPERPTGVFCANDLLAVGLLQTGLNGAVVPQDVAVVGYDDIEIAAAAAVSLSSVRQPAAELGAQALGMLIDHARSPRLHEHHRIVLKPELVVRGSTVAGL
jgi:LacI family transcriptional regulator